MQRLMIAGTNSGCGKTTITCAVMQALVNRGMRVSAFKCGPDYIDPMFHETSTPGSAKEKCFAEFSLMEVQILTFH